MFSLEKTLVEGFEFGRKGGKGGRGEGRKGRKDHLRTKKCFGDQRRNVLNQADEFLGLFFLVLMKLKIIPDSFLVFSTRYEPCVSFM